MGMLCDPIEEMPREMREGEIKESEKKEGKESRRNLSFFLGC